MKLGETHAVSDSERLNWMESNGCSVICGSFYDGWIVQALAQVRGNLGGGRSVREAIDNAMKQHPTGEVLKT